MAIVINGSGTVTGLAVGGLPDGTVDSGTIATDAVAIAALAATGTASSTTYLRGDNSWATAGSTSATDLTSGTLPAARLPTGSVLSVYYDSITTASNVGGSTYTWYDIPDLSLTITPKSSSSKFWINFRISTSTNGNHSYIGLKCDGTLVHFATSTSSRLATSSSVSQKTSWDMDESVVSYLWSPATASAVTIKPQCAFENSSLNINKGWRDTDAVYDARAVSELTVMEIEG